MTCASWWNYIPEYYYDARTHEHLIHNFTYLGSDVNCNNVIGAEIQKRVLATNRRFYGLQKHLRSHSTSRNTKILMYKLLIRPVLIYAIINIGQNYTQNHSVLQRARLLKTEINI